MCPPRKMDLNIDISFAHYCDGFGYMNLGVGTGVEFNHTV